MGDAGWRPLSYEEKQMKKESISKTIRAELAVIGGGPAGVTAAISAARLGVDTMLVTNRPVLGGNSSSLDARCGRSGKSVCRGNGRMGCAEAGESL